MGLSGGGVQLRQLGRVRTAATERAGGAWTADCQG